MHVCHVSELGSRNLKILIVFVCHYEIKYLGQKKSKFYFYRHREVQVFKLQAFPQSGLMVIFWKEDYSTYNCMLLGYLADGGYVEGLSCVHYISLLYVCHLLHGLCIISALFVSHYPPLFCIFTSLNRGT